VLTDERSNQARLVEYYAKQLMVPHVAQFLDELSSRETRKEVPRGRLRLRGVRLIVPVLPWWVRRVGACCWDDIVAVFLVDFETSRLTRANYERRVDSVSQLSR
jgi:hypothetical protein